MPWVAFARPGHHHARGVARIGPPGLPAAMSGDRLSRPRLALPCSATHAPPRRDDAPGPRRPGCLRPEPAGPPDAPGRQAHGSRGDAGATNHRTCGHARPRRLPAPSQGGDGQAEDRRDARRQRGALRGPPRRHGLLLPDRHRRAGRCAPARSGGARSGGAVSPAARRRARAPGRRARDGPVAGARVVQRDRTDHPHDGAAPARCSRPARTAASTSWRTSCRRPGPSPR